MSNTKNYLSVLFFMGFLWISCENKQAIPPVVYPNNSIYADINGPLVGEEKVSFSSPSVTFIGDLLSISATNNSSGNWSLIGIYVHAKSAGIYMLSNYNYAMASISASESPNSFSFYTDSLRTGVLNLTKFDTINHLISGTFNFMVEMQQPLRNGGTGTVSGTIKNVTW